MLEQEKCSKYKEETGFNTLIFLTSKKMKSRFCRINRLCSLPGPQILQQDLRPSAWPKILSD
jgi:hypothetical protein